MCVCVLLLLLAGRILVGIFEAAPECLYLPFSILARTPHKELCMREPARPKERTWDVDQSGVRLQSRESEIQAQTAGLVSWLLDLVPEQSEGSIDSETGRQAVKTMTRDESASLVGSCIGFSLSSLGSHTYPQTMLKRA